MCLITTSKELQKAKEDICCYKVLMVSKNNPEEIITPVRRTPVTLNKLTIAEGTPIIVNRILGWCIRLFEINKGAIHCFECLDRAEAYRYYIESYEPYFYRAVIVKAIIPKGTLYATGINGDICATQVFITNKIVLM